MRRKVAIITGVNGQDGSYLAELLLEKQYSVIGLVRRSSVNTHERINHVINKEGFMLLEADITDPSSVNAIVNRYKPDEIYNLAAQSHVKTSFDQPNFTFNVNTLGVLNILEAVRHFSPHTRFYQASTSEMFGSNFTKAIKDYPCTDKPRELLKWQDEATAFSPNSPYAVSKVAAHNLVDLYRRSYGTHASAGILFNHESERRGENFVTRKITKYVGELDKYRKKLSGFIGILTDAKVPDYPTLKLGNLDAVRDWGHAKDYVEAMYLMLQQQKPDDYVICTGKGRSVRDFLDAAFKSIGITDWSKYVEIDPQFYRPCEVEFLQGKCDKAKNVLGWEPKITFEQLVERMVKYDS